MITFGKRLITKTVLNKKDKAGGMTLLGFTQSKTTVITVACTAYSRQTDHCESRPGSPRVHSQLLFLQAAESVSWGKESLL